MVCSAEWDAAGALCVMSEVLGVTDAMERLELLALWKTMHSTIKECQVEELRQRGKGR